MRTTKQFTDLLMSLENTYEIYSYPHTQTEWDNGVAYGFLRAINKLRETLKLPRYKRTGKWERPVGIKENI